MKLFKSFVPFRHTFSLLLDALAGKMHALNDLQDKLINYAIQDPHSTEWSHTGIVTNANGDAFYATESAIMIMVSIRERILPGPVLKAEVQRRRVALAERQGRSCNKKELAILREDAEAFLLPKSHVKESFVPVIFKSKMAFICTSSHKRADQVAMLLMRALESQDIALVQTKNDYEGWLTTLAQDGAAGDFIPGDAITLVGAEGAKGTISFKGEDAGGNRVTTLIESQGYRATKMRIEFDDQLSFTLGKGMTVSGFKFHDMFLESSTAGLDKGDAKAVFDSDLTLVSQAFFDVTKALVGELGGLSEPVVENASENSDNEPEETSAPKNFERAADGTRYWRNTEPNDFEPEIFTTDVDDDEPDDPNVIEIPASEYAELAAQGLDKAPAMPKETAPEVLDDGDDDEEI